MASEILEDQSTAYSGNCHCGKIRFSITLPRSIESSPSQIASCNCSICSKNGYLIAHVPGDKYTITKGSLEKLSVYQFGHKSVSHRFCPNCGSSLFIDALDSNNLLATNIRMLNDINVKALAVNDYNGWANFVPPYEVDALVPTSTPPSYSIYCHCGDFQTIVHRPTPLEVNTRIGSCNCSICIKNGSMNLYSPLEKYEWVKGKLEELKRYEFGSKIIGHLFCGRCGTSLFTDCLAPKAPMNMLGANVGYHFWEVRAFKGIDTKEILKNIVTHIDNANKGVPYTID